MRIWEIRTPGGHEYDERGGYRIHDGFNMRDDEYERGYEEGCEHGYRKAMEHVYGGGEYGERTIHHRGSMGGSYGMRYPMDDVEMDMRRRRDSRGRYM